MFNFLLRYFAHDCRTHFPQIRKGQPDNLNEVVCQERYSRIVPSTQGTVIYRVLPPNINIHRADFLPYSKPVQICLVHIFVVGTRVGMVVAVAFY